MAMQRQHGYLVIADISGYTSFVARTELEHAHEILSDLLGVLVNRLTTMLTLSKLEGDAVFAYVPEERMQRGETLLELIEDTYVAFRRRQESMQRSTTCTCNACRAIPSLDLKFFAHHGDYILQSVTGMTEMVGSDVNLVHRLTKNPVGEASGWRGYVLFTETGLEHMGVRPANLHAQVESYEHLGDVPTQSLDLHARFDELADERRIQLPVSDGDIVVTVECTAPPAVVWEWINDQRLRSLWMEGTTWSPGARPGGRTGPGSINHCAHGNGTTSAEEVLDYRPFEYVTTAWRMNAQIIGRDTIYFEETPGGTRVTYATRMFMPAPRFVSRVFYRMMMAEKFQRMMANCSKLIAAAGRAAPG
jgi:uncharacterized protein YndB with AHSA1/START domain